MASAIQPRDLFSYLHHHTKVRLLTLFIDYTDLAEQNAAFSFPRAGVVGAETRQRLW